VGQVVQVRAGALDDDVVRVLSEHQDGATDRKQNRYVPHGETDPAKPGKDSPKH
jgi:hypothetical protein